GDTGGDAPVRLCQAGQGAGRGGARPPHSAFHFAYCGFAPPIDPTPSMPPSPIVSTAEEGTTTIAPFSLMASYSMFMARRCRATGLCWRSEEHTSELQSL